MGGLAWFANICCLCLNPHCPSSLIYEEMWGGAWRGGYVGVKKGCVTDSTSKGLVGALYGQRDFNVWCSNSGRRYIQTCSS